MNDHKHPTPAHLKSLREQAGMSQADLAVKLSLITGTATVTRHEVSRWENGKRRPTAWLDALAIAFGMDVADLTRPMPQPVSVDADDHSADLDALRSFRTADLHLGGGHLYATVTGYLQASIGPRIFGGRSSSSGVFAAAGGLTEMAGWMAHDAGHDGLALQHFKRAQEFAGIADDHELGAHICASLSHLHLHLNHATDAIAYARKGQELAQMAPSTPHLSARLSAMEARGHAARRAPADCRRSLRKAETFLASNTSSASSPWISGFDAGSLASEAARCALRLGRLDDAESHARTIIELRSGARVRSRAFGQLLLISILVEQRRLEEACALALDVIEATHALSSDLVSQRLADLRAAMAPHQTSSTARDVCDVLDEILPARLGRYGWIADTPSGTRP